MRSIGVVTVARSDYGIYLPVLRQIQDSPDLELRVLVAGMHLSPDFGSTVKLIEADGFPITERIEMLLSSDTPQGIAKSIGMGTIGFAQAFARSRPDILVVLGDRFEMYTAALAALPFKIPVAHLHGGELTHGAIDDAIRHSITKLSHLHFVSTQEYARRVIQLGEEPWRVTVSGAPSLDNLRIMPLLTPAELTAKFALRLDRPPLLVTYHPTTLEYEQTEQQTGELLAALAAFDLPMIFTASNADTASRTVMQMTRQFATDHPAVQIVNNLGIQGYFSLMNYAAAMVGNSSSGIIEAPSFKLPVVNIGKRQQGRVRGANVIDVGYSRYDIINGIQQALDPAFRDSLRDSVNPYGNGQAAAAIVAGLRQAVLDDRLLLKQFYDLEAPVYASR